MTPAELGGTGYRLDRNFELEQNDRRAFERRGARIDVLRREPHVAARGDQNLVLPGVVDDDQGDARRFVGVGCEMVETDPGAIEGVGQFAPKPVVAQLRDEPDGAAEPGAGHGLIRPLAARIRPEVVCQRRFTRTQEALAGRHEVHVRAADDDDVALFGVSSHEARR